MTRELRLEYPMFSDYVIPNGFLPLDKAAHACFYFYVLAEKMRETVGESIDDQKIEEGLPWMQTHYTQLRRTIRLLYQLESEGDIDRYWPAVVNQAKYLGLPEPNMEYRRSSLFLPN